MPTQDIGGTATAGQVVIAIIGNLACPGDARTSALGCRPGTSKSEARLLQAWELRMARWRRSWQWESRPG